MIRQFLALIAIVTGLTALGAPAQARFSGLDDVRVQVSGDTASQCQAARLTERVLPAARQERLRVQPNFCPRPHAVIRIPPVMLQADRARE